jgi:hypothetical protein
MNRYLASAFAVVAFIVAQAFQELAYRFWIPAQQGPAAELRNYLLPVDQARAILIAATIVLLLVPYVVITLRYFRVAPIASILGLLFGAGFVAAEIVHRSLDFFLVGSWARQFEASDMARDVIVQRYALWNDFSHAWYFPLLLAVLLSSCCYAWATWSERRRSAWFWLAPIAFLLNALRVFGRMLSMFAHQTWLDGLNDRLYFPGVLLVDGLLVIWFLYLARQEPGKQFGADSQSAIIV